MVDACLVTWGAVRSDGNLEVQQVGLVRTLGAPLEGEIGISYILSLSYSQLPQVSTLIYLMLPTTMLP